MTINAKKLFILKEDHLKLLRNMIVGWDRCEFGAPAIDCKKPYGNSSVYVDMAKILGIKGFIDEDEEILFSKEQIQHMNNLHKETETALQIILRTGKFEAGVYVADEYSDNWERQKV